MGSWVIIIERKSYQIHSTIYIYISLTHWLTYWLTYSLSHFTVPFHCPISLSYFTVLFHCPISLSYGLSHLLTLYKIQIWVFFWFTTHVLKPPVLLWSQYIQLVLQPNIYCYLFNNIYFSHRLYSRYIFFLFNYIIPSSWLYIERKSYWIYSTNSYIYSLSYFTVLFRRPISATYFGDLFRGREFVWQVRLPYIVTQIWVFFWFLTHDLKGCVFKYLFIIYRRFIAALKKPRRVSLFIFYLSYILFFTIYIYY